MKEGKYYTNGREYECVILHYNKRKNKYTVQFKNENLYDIVPKRELYDIKESDVCKYSIPLYKHLEASELNKNTVKFHELLVSLDEDSENSYLYGLVNDVVVYFKNNKSDFDVNTVIENLGDYKKTLLDDIFGLKKIPEWYRLLLLRFLFDMGVCAYDTIPKIKDTMSIFKSAMDNFSRDSKIKVLYLLREYGYDKYYCKWYMDTYYCRYMDKYTKETIVKIMNDGEVCKICDCESELSYKPMCCSREGGDKFICVCCLDKLKKQECPWCRKKNFILVY